MMFQNGLMLFQPHMKSAGWYQESEKRGWKTFLNPMRPEETSTVVARCESVWAQNEVIRECYWQIQLAVS